MYKFALLILLVLSFLLAGCGTGVVEIPNCPIGQSFSHFYGECRETDKTAPDLQEEPDEATATQRPKDIVSESIQVTQEPPATQDSQAPRDEMGNTAPEAWGKSLGLVDDPGNETWEYYWGKWSRGEVCAPEEIEIVEFGEWTFEMCPTRIAQDASIVLVSALTPGPLDDIAVAAKILGVFKNANTTYIVLATTVIGPSMALAGDIITDFVEITFPREHYTQNMTSQSAVVYEELPVTGEILQLFSDAETHGEESVIDDVGIETDPNKDPCREKPGLPDDAVYHESIVNESGMDKYIVQFWTTRSGEPIAKGVMNLIDVDGGTWVVTHHIFTYPEWRGKGIATQVAKMLNRTWRGSFENVRNTLVAFINLNPSYKYSCYWKDHKDNEGPAYNDGTDIVKTHWLK